MTHQQAIMLLVICILPVVVLLVCILMLMKLCYRLGRLHERARWFEKYGFPRTPEDEDNKDE